MPDNKQGSGRGFASMDEDKQREIASEGGKASGGNFANNQQRAQEAGRQGGQQSGGHSGQRGSDQGMKRGGQQMAEGGGRRQEDDSGGQHGADSRPGREGKQQRAEERDGGGPRGGSGNFANDRDRASEAGRKGGKA